MPNVHQAIGWWPDKRITISWDLSTSQFPRYHRQFTQDELRNSPFDPPLQFVKLIIGEDSALDWTYDLAPRHGANYISLKDLIEQIVQLMHREAVSLHQFERASPQMQWAIVHAYCRRTRKQMPGGLTGHPQPQLMKYFREEMRAIITQNATVGCTNLKVMDLLGDKVMFMGLCNVEQASKWLLMTTTRDKVPR